jgi:hypothetical protein
MPSPSFDRCAFYYFPIIATSIEPDRPTESPEFKRPIARDNESIHVNPVIQPGLATPDWRLWIVRF